MFNFVSNLSFKLNTRSLFQFQSPSTLVKQKYLIKTIRILIEIQNLNRNKNITINNNRITAVRAMFKTILDILVLWVK